MTNSTLSVTLLAAQDVMSGGAAKASARLQRAYLKRKIDSRLCVALKRSDWHTVDGPSTQFPGKSIGQVRSKIGHLLSQLHRPKQPKLRSPALLPSGLVSSLNASAVDILHLHWIHNEFLSIEDIGKLTKPLVWTLHDMWPFVGAEHYAADEPDSYWRVGYTSKDRFMTAQGLDLDRWVWQRKLRSWRQPIHIIAPSQWMAHCVKDSALMHDWPVSVIPNVLDTEVFRPWPKKMARALLGLPEEKTIILFGAIGGGTDPRKGRDLLQSALATLATQSAELSDSVLGVIFGQSEPKYAPSIGIPLHWLDAVYDEVTLAIIYSAADVTVVPSRQDNLPQTATEAQACGCPVVAFNVTGLPSAVTDRVTGYLARPFDVDDLAAGIRWTIEDANKHRQLSHAARQRAVKLWSPNVVVKHHLALYEAVRRRQQKGQEKGQEKG